MRGIAAIAAARASTSTMLAELQALQITQQARVDEAAAAHREARREVKTIEKLEERHIDAERAEALRVDQIAIDELASRMRAVTAADEAVAPVNRGVRA